MRKILSTVLISLISVGILLGKEKKAVIIIVDGIPTDAIERLHVPVLYDIASKGALGPRAVGGEVGTYSQTQTISAVGYNPMLTGTWANKHNVWGNSKQFPNYNYWSLFRIAKAQDKPVTTGLYSSWTDNRTVLLGEGKAETDNLKIDFIRDGYDLDIVNFPKKENDLHVFDYDEKVSFEAAESIRNDAPVLSWVYLWYTDDAAHRYGDGPEMDDAVLKAGKQIQRVWDAVQYRQKHFDEEWLIIVTTDHGRAVKGHRHGGQSARERKTWIATNAKVNKYFRKGKASMVDINPTVCRFLNFDVPFEVSVERDGVPFIGNLDITDMDFSRYGDTVTVTWTAVDRKAPVKVYLSESNEFKETGHEKWTLVGEVKASEERFQLQIPNGNFCKIALVAPDNTLNRWYVDKLK